ncbi:hypothetical protein C3495_05025 [Clostridiaceae bacterium 14S0207]|nr:hypothetical protein C3495_05025 [Clostridiaceae bacterium 14S0207]
MYRLTWTSKGAMMAQQEKLDSISNNMANVNTTGYKKVTVGFSDLLNESLVRRGYPLIDEKNGRLQHSTGVKPNKWIRENVQGSLKETGIATDLALDGDGYFQIDIPEGNRTYKAFTRDGSFKIDVKGDLVDGNGNYVTIMKNGNKVRLSDLGVRVSSDNISISTDGDINIKNGNNIIDAGKIQVKKFVGNNALESKGNSVYVPKQGATELPADDYSIHSGYVELSNVDLGDEMTDLIITQRAFQLSANALKTSDEMWGMVNNLRGR